MRSIVLLAGLATLSEALHWGQIPTVPIHFFSPDTQQPAQHNTMTHQGPNNDETYSYNPFEWRGVQPTFYGTMLGSQAIELVRGNSETFVQFLPSRTIDGLNAVIAYASRLATESDVAEYHIKWHIAETIWEDRLNKLEPEAAEEKLMHLVTELASEPETKFVD